MAECRLHDGHASIQRVSTQGPSTAGAHSAGLLAEGLEVGGAKVAHEPGRANEGREVLDRAFAVLAPLCGDLADLSPTKLICQVMIAGALDDNVVWRYIGLSWLPTCVEVGGYSKVAGQGGVGAIPDAEEAQLAADLLAPLPVVVGGERKRRIRL
jgi:hypothetical protein